jgi:hypothetical protein
MKKKIAYPNYFSSTLALNIFHLEMIDIVM